MGRSRSTARLSKDQKDAVRGANEKGAEQNARLAEERAQEESGGLQGDDAESGAS